MPLLSMNIVLKSSGEQRWAKAKATRFWTTLSATRIKYNKWDKTYIKKIKELQSQMFLA